MTQPGECGRNRDRGFGAVVVLLVMVVSVLGTLLAAGSSTQARSPWPEACQQGDADPGCIAAQPPARAAAGNPADLPATHSIWLPVMVRGTRPEFGVQLYRNQVSLAEHAANTGAGWVRIPLYWYEVEPVNSSPEDYQWSEKLDEQLATLSRNHVQIILTLEGNPSWAATYPGGSVDRTDIAELAEFMEAAVRRYGAPPYNVKHWELYNEPDNGSEELANKGYGYFGYEPELYVEMLATVYGPIKGVDPEAQVVLGGLAYDRWTSADPPGPFVEDFIDKVLEGGGAAYFDLMNFHYYPSFRALWQPYGQGIIGKASYLRRKMAAYDVYKPVICTETGMWSDVVHGGSDEQQSRYVTQVLARAMAADVQPIIWFQLVDASQLGDYWFGLLDRDLRPKPSHKAFHTAVEQLMSAEYVRTLEAGETGSGQIEAYEFLADGGWTRMIMAWTNDEQPNTLVVETPWITVVDKYGGETTLSDGDDGLVDGKVTAPIGPSPVYLRFEP